MQIYLLLLIKEIMIIKFFIKFLCPFSLLENNGFREYEAYKCTIFDIPTRKTLLNMVIDHKQIVRSKLLMHK